MFGIAVEGLEVAGAEEDSARHAGAVSGGLKRAPGVGNRSGRP
mgnify:CR=1 FL=1